MIHSRTSVPSGPTAKRRSCWRNPARFGPDAVPRMLDNIPMAQLAIFLAQAVGVGGIPPTIVPSSADEPDDSGLVNPLTKHRLLAAMESM
jgi:hypothetical protein